MGGRQTKVDVVLSSPWWVLLLETNPLQWTGQQWVLVLGCVWALFNTLLVCYAAAFVGDKKTPATQTQTERASTPSKPSYTPTKLLKSGGKNAAGSNETALKYQLNDSTFDLNTFLKHLRKGTFDVNTTTEDGGRTGNRVAKLQLTIDNCLTLSANSSNNEEFGVSPSFQLHHLVDAQIDEDGETGELSVNIFFEDTNSLVLHTKAEDDLVYLAKGFHTLARRLAVDSKFVEALLTTRDTDDALLPAGSGARGEAANNASLSSQVIVVTNAVLSIPVLPLYGILNALSSSSNDGSSTNPASASASVTARTESR